VVVFDGGSPRLPEVPSLPGRRIRSVVNDRTPGLAGARNAGVEAARGELIAFLDDDDEWFPHKLRLQVEAFRQRPDATVVGSGIELHFGGRVFNRIPHTDEVTFDHLLGSRFMEIHSSNLLMRRADLVGRIGLVDETLPGSQAEDYDLLLRAARHGPVVVVRQPLVRVFWHPSSFFQESWASLADALVLLLERTPEFRHNAAGYARVAGQVAFYRAAAGDRRSAVSWAARAIGSRWRERRAYLALAVALRLVSASRVLRLAHRFGKGI
jgi:glycosyltransferase involved in cell wall biosynthesis